MAAHHNDLVVESSFPKVIAYYLPQFHPIPENDQWWGKGFTEWTNVTKSKPLFWGHVQPQLPSDLGFYDLRVPEARESQAELAKNHGVHGFCYWHYWFGNGRRILERPFEEVLNSGAPNFPFCLAWANETWAGVHHGVKSRILINQTYPGESDFEKHFYAIEPAFHDPRYIRVEGKPIFLVYRPLELPAPREFTQLWRKLAEKSGLPGIYFVGIGASDWKPNQNGFDAAILHEPWETLKDVPIAPIDYLCRTVLKRDSAHFLKKIGIPKLFNYKDYVDAFPDKVKDMGFDTFPCIVPNWDTTPRLQKHAVILNGSNPKLFKELVAKALAQVCEKDAEKQLIFVKSWNEWAEGNYLEPSLLAGRGYLEAIRDSIRPAH